MINIYLKQNKKLLIGVWKWIKFPILALIIYFIASAWMANADLERKNPTGICQCTYDVFSAKAIAWQNPCCLRYLTNATFKADADAYYNGMDSVKLWAALMLLWSGIGLALNYWEKQND